MQGHTVRDIGQRTQICERGSCIVKGESCDVRHKGGVEKQTLGDMAYIEQQASKRPTLLNTITMLWRGSLCFSREPFCATKIFSQLVLVYEPRQTTFDERPKPACQKGPSPMTGYGDTIPNRGHKKTRERTAANRGIRMRDEHNIFLPPPHYKRQHMLSSSATPALVNVHG